ncbi:unnamed protein product [Cylicocyclus nassatus]|uniref:Uncharacterized protein n=1 Tax=Cylicocyclus nassatus TaxID=53992 RepID=A0AA36M6B1_CYLNA|nr:unnamed protein product [Cylicocyclus nassatus]
MHSLQQEKSGLQAGGVWLKPDITSDISNIPSLKIPAKYSKRPYEGNGTYPAMKTARVDSDLSGDHSPSAFRNARTSSAHDADDYREKSKQEDRSLLAHGRDSKNSLDSRSSIPMASESWRTPAKPPHPEKPEAPSREWSDDFAHSRMLSARDRYESDRLEWERRRDELSTKELAAHHTRSSYVGSQQGRAAEDRIALEKSQSMKPVPEADRVPKKGTYDTLMKVVMGSIGPKFRADDGGFDQATRESIHRSSASSALERSIYSKQSPASFGSSLPSFGGGRLHDTGVALASSAAAPRSESWRNLSNEKSSAMSKPAWTSTAPHTESWRNSSASAGSESWRNLKKDVPQSSWVKSTNLIGGANVAGGPSPMSRTFDRFPTFGGRPPFGSELNRDMRLLRCGNSDVELPEPNMHIVEHTPLARKKTDSTKSIHPRFAIHCQHGVLLLYRETSRVVMRSGRQGVFPPRDRYFDRNVGFYPRREDGRGVRNAADPYTRGNRVESDYSRSGRNGGSERDVSDRRIIGGFADISERKVDQYSNNRAGPSYRERDYANPVSRILPAVPENGARRYNYFDESRMKSTSQPNPYSRDSRGRESRNGYGYAPRESERSSSSLPGPSTLSRETRELEQRMAAIQRELDMLDTDKKGNRSPGRGSRRERERRPYEEARSSIRAPAAPYPPPRIDSVERARLDREREQLRKREMELARREEELARKERRMRERSPPRPLMELPRERTPPRLPVLPPQRKGTFPKTRRFLRTLPSWRRRQIRKREQRALDNLEIILPRKRGISRTEDFLMSEESTIAPKKRKEAKREFKDEGKEEVPTDKPGRKKGRCRGKAVDHIVNVALGQENPNEYVPPRQRALAVLFGHCDKSLMSAEVLRRFGVVEAKTEPVEKDAYKKRTCIRTYNPTTYGPLDQFVPLRSFEDEVILEPSDSENDKILENMKAILGFFPKSPEHEHSSSDR